MSKRNAGGVPQTFFLEIMIFGRKQPLKKYNEFLKDFFKKCPLGFSGTGRICSKKISEQTFIGIAREIPKEKSEGML